MANAPTGRPRQIADKLRLIVATDRKLARPRGVLAVVSAALRAGCPAVQVREKELPPRDLLPLARELRRATRAAGSLLFVNDRLDLAIAVGADGVHLGPGDLPVAHARRLAPSGFLIGYSASTVATAEAATDAGADYIGCGPLHPTATKRDAGRAIGLKRLARVARAVDVPVVAIGGITTAGTARAAIDAGATGVAAIGAVMSAEDPHRATSALLDPKSAYKASA